MLPSSIKESVSYFANLLIETFLLKNKIGSSKAYFSKFTRQSSNWFYYVWHVNKSARHITSTVCCSWKRNKDFHSMTSYISVEPFQRRYVAFQSAVSLLWSNIIRNPNPTVIEIKVYSVFRSKNIRPLEFSHEPKTIYLHWSMKMVLHIFRATVDLLRLPCEEQKTFYCFFYCNICSFTEALCLVFWKVKEQKDSILSFLL